MKLPIKLYEVGDINHMVYDIVQTPNVILEQCQRNSWTGIKPHCLRCE